MFKEPVMNKAKITSPGYFSLQATSDVANDSGNITAWIKLSLTVLAQGLCFTLSIFRLCFMYCKKIIWNMDRLTTQQPFKKKKKKLVYTGHVNIKCVSEYINAFIFDHKNVYDEKKKKRVVLPTWPCPNHFIFLLSQCDLMTVLMYFLCVSHMQILHGYVSMCKTAA